MRLTADRLGLTGDERRALKRAGVTPADFAHLSADDIVAATGEDIDDGRARHLVALAGLIRAGVGASFSATLLERGIRDREDLASRSPEALFIELLDTTARNNPLSYDHFCQVIYLAGTDHPDRDKQSLAWWTNKREESGFDPILMYWRHVHGDRVPLPRATGERLRIPAIGVSAPIVEGDHDDAGRLVMPLGQKEVVRPIGDDYPVRVLVGHWMWRGGHGAFVRLEDVEPGDGVQVGDRWFSVIDVERVAVPSRDDELPLRNLDADLVLATPPHRRAGIIGLPHMLDPVEREVLQVVARAREADESEIGRTRRPLRPVRGAF